MDQYRYFAKTLYTTTYHRTILTIGAIAKTFWEAGMKTRANGLLFKLHEMINIHGKY